MLSTPILEPSLKSEWRSLSTEEAVVAEVTRSINDPQNGSNPADFISIFWQNQNLFLPCCFIVAFAGMSFGTPLVFYTREETETQQRTRQRDNSDFHIIVLDTYPSAGGG